MPIQAGLKFGALTIKVNANDPQDVFHQLGIFSEAPGCCGKCGSQDIIPTHRQDGEGNDYYGLRCREGDCGAVFDIGQKKQGGLFPKANPDRENHTNGWYFFHEQSFGKGGDGGRRDDRGSRGGNHPQRGGGYDRGGGGSRDQRGGGQQRQGPTQGRGRQDSYDEADEIPFN